MLTFSYLYSIPYITAFVSYFLLFLLEANYKKKNINTKIIRNICIFIFVIFFGFRAYLYTDYAVYYPIFKETPPLWNFHKVLKFYSINNDLEITRIEPGFKLFLIIVKSFSSNYFVLQFISSLIDLFLLNYFFKKYSIYYALSFALFFVFEGLILEINLLRNIKAILIFLFALQYIDKRKPFHYFGFCFLALLFHSSSIFFFPLYFFLHKKIPQKIIWILFFLGNIIYLAQFQFVANIAEYITNVLGGSYQLMFENYSTDDLYNKSRGITIGFIERCMSFIILFLSYKKISNTLNKPHIVNIFFNSYLIYFISFTFLSEFSIFTERVAPLFIYSYWILYTYYFRILKTKFIRNVFCLGMLIFGCVKIYVGNNNILADYQNILFGNRTFEQAEARRVTNFDKIQKK